MSNDKEINVENDNAGADVDSSYQPPPQKSIEEIVAADQEDESLRKYKEALLGAAQSEKIIVGKCGHTFCPDRGKHFEHINPDFISMRFCSISAAQMQTIHVK